MSKVTNSLKKKWGPLPAWAWLLGLGLLYYFYRKYSATSSVSGTGTGNVSPAPVTPQPITTLGAGESAYDPNSGALVTAPGGGSTDSSAGIDAFTQAMNNLADAIASGMPDNTNPGSNNPTDNPPAGTPPGTTATGGAKGKPKLTGKGALYAPFGHNRPKAKTGYTIKGLGRGFWEYVPKRTPKSKGQHNATKKTSKPIPPGGKTRTRSTTSVRHATGGRSTARQPAKTGLGHRVVVNHTASNPQQPSRARQRPRTPAAQTVVQQRRPATMPRQSPTRQTGGMAPRPSAPAPRTVRAPKPPPPKPKPKKRG